MKMSISIFTIIDDDITINESIQESEDKNNNINIAGINTKSAVYEYITKIVNNYYDHKLLIYLVLTTDSNIYYIRLYDNIYE